MEVAVGRSLFRKKTLNKNLTKTRDVSDLTHGNINISYTIKQIDTRDQEMEKFLFSLGCYEGEKITLISVLADNYIVNIKDARYSINEELAKGILI